MTVFQGLKASGPDRNTPTIPGIVEPICTVGGYMTRFVISTEPGGCMVISEANPFRDDVPYGAQSSHLPPAPTGTLLLGVPAQLVWCPSVTTDVTRHVWIYPLCPPNPLWQMGSMSEALRDACRQRRTPFATGRYAEAVNRNDASYETTSNLYPRQIIFKAAILSKPFANVGGFLIPVQQDQASRQLPVLGPSLAEAPNRCLQTAEADPSIGEPAIVQHVGGRGLRVR